MHRLYENNDISVFWNSDKCRHAKRCVTLSPSTFDITRRPWINLGIAPTAEIWKAVSECPTGALTCVYNHGISIVLDEDGHKSIALDGDTKVGECDYSVTSDGWEIYHTEVLPKYSEKGIAKRLVYRLLEAADKSGVKVIPTCSYAKKVMDKE